MSSFPGSPRLMKGAIIGIDKYNPLASIVVFQYNPDSLTRRINARYPELPSAAEQKGDSQEKKAPPNRSVPPNLTGPPTETIALNVEIDATDQLEQGSLQAGTMGIYPALSALEMLLYPKSAYVIPNFTLQKTGVVGNMSYEPPLTLFIWGVKRVVPVRVDGMNITEEAFDADLNPIRAKVDLSLQILTYQALSLGSPGGALFMAHQIMKEAMATLNGAGGLGGLASMSASLNVSASFKIGG